MAKYVTCSYCGAKVSNTLSDEVIVGALVECLECGLKHHQEKIDKADKKEADNG